MQQRIKWTDEETTYLVEKLSARSPIAVIVKDWKENYQIKNFPYRNYSSINNKCQSLCKTDPTLQQLYLGGNLPTI